MLSRGTANPSPVAVGLTAITAITLQEIGAVYETVCVKLTRTPLLLMTAAFIEAGACCAQTSES